MAPRTKIQNSEIRESRRQEILLAALELFSKEGYHSTSIAGIARNANISKGLIYNYFQSKEDLLKTIITKGLGEMEQYLKRPDNRTMVKDDLVRLIDDVFEMLIKSREFWRLFTSIIVQPDVMEIISKELRGVTNAMVNLMKEYLQQTGSRAPLEDAYILGALFDGISLNFIINPDDFPLESVKNRVKEIFVGMH